MNLLDVFYKAKEEKWAIGQFNFSTDEQLKAIVKAAEELDSPVILGTSEGESSFFGLKEAIAERDVLRKKTNLPIFLNLDHGRDLDYIKKAVEEGYDCVHFDGSNLSLEENIQKTKEIVNFAKQYGALVEGEINPIGNNLVGGKLTDPQEALNFIKQTGVNSLAVAIGNVHGVFDKMPTLDLKRLQEIDKTTDTFLVLHGGSGIPEEEIKKTIKFGIVKININTELRVEWKESLVRSLEESDSIKPYEILPAVINKISKVVSEKIKLFGSFKKL
ncbi:MAG: class II fructose-bisphosphate aldolase [Patescibacteria group bacterium]